MKWISILRQSSSLLLVLFALSCGHSEKVAAPAKPEVCTTPMKGTPVKKTPIPIYYEVVGTINAKTSTVIQSKIPGQVKEVRFKEGDRVNADDLLIVIDDRDINAKLNQAKAAYDSSQKAIDEIDTSINQAKAAKQEAEANLKLAESTYQRFAKLYQEKATSEQEFDTVKAKLEVARAEVNRASEGIAQIVSKKNQIHSSIDQARSGVEEANVTRSYSQILAPFDGVVVKKSVEVGSMALPGVPLLTLENPQGFRLEVEVREKEFANKVQIGRDVAVKVDALGTQVIYGKVAEMVPSANPMSRTFKVKIALPNLVGLQSGMYGKALCHRGERDGILIPTSAYIKRGQLEQVFTYEPTSKTAHLRLIKTGKMFENQWEIVAGLDDGDILITNPASNLRDGNLVTVEVAQ
jgi:multidrug efflux pump subunit AcrA (membrane-fusion protein)